MKAIIYAAKSTEDVHGSIPTQLEDATELVEREGGSVVASYSDEAASAWSGDRGPELAEAMAHAERITPCWLVVQHTDRLARGDGKQSRHLVEIILWGLKHDVRVRSVQDDSTGENLVMAAVMGMRNNEDSTRKSQAVAAGMKRRKEAGKHHGGPRPYGYRYEGGELVTDKTEAEIVRRIYSEYVAGRSQLAIMRGLRRDNVPTAKGGEWHGATVRNILCNPVYKGMIGAAEGQHRAIVDAETWAKAEALRSSKARTTGSGRPPAGNHLFRKGMLRCGCGAAMVPRTNRNRKGPDYEIYWCYGRQQDPESCDMPAMRREFIDTAIYRYFEKVGLDVEATEAAMSETRSMKVTEVSALLDQARTEQQKATERLARIKRDYASGDLLPADFYEFRDELAPELEAATAEVERLTNALAALDADDDLRDLEREVLDRLVEIRRAIVGEITNASGVEAVRAAMSRLFSHFVVHPLGKGLPPEPTRDEGDFSGTETLVVVDWAERGRMLLLPVIRTDAIAHYDPETAATPILRRVPLDDAANNGYMGLPTHSLFGPIPVTV